MTTPTDLHNEAMNVATDADSARRAGDESTALALFSKAFELESEAARLVPEDLEPTRSILIRSAASLAMEANRLCDAERMVGLGLASASAPVEVREELRHLFDSITFRNHLRLHNVTLSAVEFQLSFAGDSVGYGLMPAGEYFPRIQSLDNMLTRTAERLRGQTFREHSRSPRALAREVGMYVTTSQAGSYSVVLRLGGTQKQGRLFNPVEEVVDELLACLLFFSEGTEVARDKLFHRINDEAYYRNFIYHARSISPDGKRVSTVGFSRDPKNEKGATRISLRRKLCV